MRRLAIRLGLPVVLVAGLLAGCTAGSGCRRLRRHRGQRGISAEEPAVLGPEAAGDQSGGGEAVGVADVDGADRQVVTTGSVTLTVEQPRLAARDAAAIVEASGGHVQERVEQAGEETSLDTASLVVRVPADGLTQVLGELERLGRVDSVELTSNDVTAQAQDLDARIRALEISVARLEDLLGRAQSTADVVAAEETLTERQSDLESLQSQRGAARGLRGDVDRPAAVPERGGRAAPRPRRLRRRPGDRVGLAGHGLLGRPARAGRAAAVGPGGRGAPAVPRCWSGASCGAAVRGCRRPRPRARPRPDAVPSPGSALGRRGTPAGRDGVRAADHPLEHARSTFARSLR